MYFLGKSSPTPPTSFTGEKKLAATAAWLAEPPSSRGFSAFGVLMESSAVVPTIRTLIFYLGSGILRLGSGGFSAWLFLLNQFNFVAFGRVNEGDGAAAAG